MSIPHDNTAAPETGRLSLFECPAWHADDHQAAFSAFCRTPDDPLSGVARCAGDARVFFETHFDPGPMGTGDFTGYYEPEIDGSLTRSDTFPVPLHTMPQGGCDLPRSDMDAALRGSEILWVRDEVDRFFLQVQGSGRIRLADGKTLRAGYAGKTDQPYLSIGKLLIERGIFGPDITADALKTWLRADPERGRAVMSENPSYVFFTVRDDASDVGPLGTLGCPVSAGRTIAVDPDHIPLGSPVWIEVDGMARLCIAQDTGSAIKGAGRVDLFFGTGEGAGLAAGRLNHAGRVTPLMRR
ncbi:MAG: MltA domain-containing protein [Jannaschia sp.]